MKVLNTHSTARKFLALGLLTLSMAITGCLTDDKTTTGGPTISVQPSDQVVAAGGSASFAVVASGSGSLSYQWMRNDVDIAGATSKTYALAASVNDDGAAFKVKVTDTKGTITSNPVFLHILVTARAVTLGAQNNSSPSSLDLDTWTAYTASQATAHSQDIDLVFAFSTSGVNDSAALYSPIVAKNGVNGSGGFDFMTGWASANSTDIRVVSVADWNNVKTSADIKAIYDAGVTPNPAGRVFVNIGKTVVAKSNSGLYVLLRIDAVTQSASGTAVITGKAMSL